MINYIKGDATNPVCKPAVICHINNDIGKWGKGFVIAISNKWPQCRECYIDWHIKKLTKSHFINGWIPFKLGNIQIIKISEELFVCNMIAQHGIYPYKNDPPIRYDAVNHCLEKLNNAIYDRSISVHAPRIGCGLAGGQWTIIESLINKHFSNIYIYDNK